VAGNNYSFKNSSEMGAVVEPWPGTIPLDVWRYVIDLNTRQQTSLCKRERMRTLQEVFVDLRAKLEVAVCEKCGHERPLKDGRDYAGDKCKKCGDGEYAWFIDEYFSGPDTYRDSPTLVPHDFRWIACYPVTGGSEGHYVHVDFMVPVEQVRIPDPDNWSFGSKLVRPMHTENLWRAVRLALGKTFRGMDHAAEMAKRCAKLLGA
jgi:hypothetical protein